jgi:hypothetical protein
MGFLNLLNVNREKLWVITTVVDGPVVNGKKSLSLVKLSFRNAEIGGPWS